MEQKTNSFWRKFAWVGGAVFVTWVAFAVLLWAYGGDFTKSGPYGDTFGLLNTLFSGLAFAGMICTLIMQKQELELQRQELADTREELKRTAEANEKTAELAAENIKQQRDISNIQNSYTKNQILAQKHIAMLNNIYKIIEFTYQGYAAHAQGYKDYEREIKEILKKLESLKTVEGPIDEDQAPSLHA